MAIDIGGNVSECIVNLCVIAPWVECFSEMSNWCRDEQV